MKASSAFFPIPALWNNASDVLLFLLSTNDVHFLEACHDPWYAATTRIDKKMSPTSPWGNNTTIPLYVRDEPARVLGCASRYQLCIAKSGKSKSEKSCTPLAGYRGGMLTSVDALWQTDGQRSIFDAWLKNIWFSVSSISSITSVAGIASLKARDSLAFGLQGSLPNNQWQLEVENWYGASLADLQKWTVEYATGPIEPALLQILKRPQTEGEHQLCQNVVSVSTFSLFRIKRRFLFED